MDPGTDTFDVHVPDVEGSVNFRVERDHLVGHLALGALVQPQLGERSVPAENGEVDALGVSVCTGRQIAPAAGLMRFHRRGSFQPSIVIGTGLAPQIRSPYSRMARSDENLPARAVLRMDIRV